MIIKANSNGMVTYKTDSTIMLKRLEELSYSDSLMIFQKKMITSDSLVDMLFTNGLLTPDLLIKAMNAESKWLDYKGDTIDQTSHIHPEYVSISQCKKKAFPHELKHKRKAIRFEIAVVFGVKREPLADFIGPPVIRDFELDLKGNIKPSDLNLNRYLKNARIACLRYVGIEI